MLIPNKAVRDTSPFQLAEYPISIPRMGEQAALDKWYYDLRAVLLRERDTLLKRIEALETASGAGTGESLSETVATLTADVTALSATVSALSASLSAHAGATTAHGSNGAVAGMNDLVFSGTANGFLTMSVNASGVTSVSFASNIRLSVVAATFEAGAVPYTWEVSLSNANREVGDVMHFKMQLPASTNPTVVIKDLASGADLVSFTHDGVAGFFNLIFVFNSDHNFYVHAVSAFEPL